MSRLPPTPIGDPNLRSKSPTRQERVALTVRGCCAGGSTPRDARRHSAPSSRAAEEHPPAAVLRHEEIEGLEREGEADREDRGDQHSDADGD